MKMLILFQTKLERLLKPCSTRILGGCTTIRRAVRLSKRIKEWCESYILDGDGDRDLGSGCEDTMRSGERLEESEKRVVVVTFRFVAHRGTKAQHYGDAFPRGPDDVVMLHPRVHGLIHDPGTGIPEKRTIMVIYTTSGVAIGESGMLQADSLAHTSIVTSCNHHTTFVGAGPDCWK
ncbi:hypothetical protein P152DRAFT_516474 [Eremomyces bilateralis CBS 781.70]|uniref:Uncharacterized protein n=1 Tax=Eremomyces bilateralis CBS 781.70 TaxID=1392243 RepID=A0A6G1FVP6_9PEZI|nr:uncharacterized protein P152DRAFT_516474 [Eremomyces bilateralis CBS 781.70]KAF1809780.1 hypothetical protein P152DRAFT_516474 [Eremomyces bilateralis CBS 781.70]